MISVITESRKLKSNNWPIKIESTVKQGILREEVHFCQGRTFPGVTRAWDHPCVTLQTLMSQTMQVCRSRTQEASGVGGKTLKLVTYSKIQSRAVSEQLVRIGWYVFGKSCQHNVSHKHLDMCKDHLQSKAHERKTPCYIYSLMVRVKLV